MTTINNADHTYVCVVNGTIDGYADYYFYVDTSDKGELQYSTQWFGCTKYPCNKTKTWYIDGSCYGARVIVSIVETDYLWFNDKPYIHINGHLWGECDRLNGANSQIGLC